MYAILIVLLSFATVASAEMRVTTDDAIKAATKKNEPDCRLPGAFPTHRVRFLPRAKHSSTAQRGKPDRSKKPRRRARN